MSLFQTSTKDLGQLKANEIVNELNLAITQRDVGSVESFLDLKKHKSVSVRRKLAELLAELGDQSKTDFLKNWQNLESDRPTWIKIETAIDRINRKNGQQKYDAKIFSVGEALGLVKGLLGSREYIIKGEISESNVSNQMYFFKMKDLDGVVMDCGCFAGIIYRAGFGLIEGIEVKVTGKFKISNKSSRLYFDVNKIELTGEGEYIRNLKLLEEKLQNEGLMDESRKRKPGILPRRILLIASPNSAAITDLLRFSITEEVGWKYFIYLLRLKEDQLRMKF
ncbi:MAG: exodeoxyribonuclease VII large subunit [Thermales bacterium]|nr:exodeoxyribonuclease VII large subunit [Thermales bacterium]